VPEPALERLAVDPRVFVRRAGAPNPEGQCVLYWMQRAQRADDNPALDLALAAGNLLHLPVVVFFGPVPYYPNANLRHYTFLFEGVPELAAGIARRRAGFVYRPYPNHHLGRVCEELRPALVIGDEDALRLPERWREKAARLLVPPLWTVDADVVVPSRLIGREHFAARTIRPRIEEHLGEFLVPARRVVARVPWRRPRSLLGVRATAAVPPDFPIDRTIAAVDGYRGGSGEAQRRLRRFLRGACAATPRAATGRSSRGRVV